MIPPSGPVPASIMLLAEAPGQAEVLRREPLTGAAGQELNRMLHEAKIMRSECFSTHVCRVMPPHAEINEWFTFKKTQPAPEWVRMGAAWCHLEIPAGLALLRQEIELVKPNVIVAFGNVALWALTGKWGIKSWRGSLLQASLEYGECKVVPAYHPAYVLRDWSTRAITVQDFRRVREQSATREMPRTDNRFIIRPSFDTVSAYLHVILAQLQEAPTTLSVDIETRAGHIACLGIATDKQNAICIPFMCVEREDGYWSEGEETFVIQLLQRVLCHPNARCVGQNFIYDSQYIYRHWHFVPNFCRDTMLAHHTQFAGLPKGLDFLSSMYCAQHVYWKDEGKTWDKNTGEEQLWVYNCKDCIVTFEVDEVIQRSIDQLGLREQHDFQMSMFEPVLEAMIRGVRVDAEQKGALAAELRREIASREAFFAEILGHPLNPRSPLQMKRLFYEDLKQKEVFNRKTGTVTLNDEALQKIALREPLLRPLVRAISEHRSLGVFLATFVDARLDSDGRLRCSYNIAGTETFRLSSSQNAFDSGLNLQNVPKGGTVDKDDPNALRLPNVRKLFIPDPGFTFFDCDLDRADLQVVVWEAGDAGLKQMLREGVDLHAENAKTLGVTRQLAKMWVHGTNYGASARTMAINCGISVHQAEKMRHLWFSAHPGIAEWHRRTEAHLHAHRFVTNKFGYRRYYFDRVEGILPEALAWQPQSTVALVINRIWRRIYDQLPQVQVLLQVHDSLAGQFPTHLADAVPGWLRAVSQSVVVPYDDPLVIPLGLKTSTKSWGDCE